MTGDVIVNIGGEKPKDSNSMVNHGVNALNDLLCNNMPSGGGFNTNGLPLPTSNKKESSGISKTLAAKECLTWIGHNMKNCYILIGCGFLCSAANFIYSPLSLLGGLISISLGVFFLRKSKIECIRLKSTYNI